MLWRGWMMAALAASAPQGASAGVLTDLFNATATERGVRVEANVAFGSGVRDRLDIFRPPAGQERAPVIVFFYGGGWTSGERATYRFVGHAFAARGYTTVLPDYRLYPEVRFPAFVDDARRAVAWTRETPGCRGERPIVLAGHSAGGWLAAMVALGPADARERTAALIGLAGPYAFDPTTWPTTRDIFAPAAGDPDRARPVAFVRPGAPPTFLATGAADTTVKPFNADDLATALRRAGSPVERKVYDGLGHAALVMATARPLRWRAPVLEDAVAFLEQHLGTAAAPACAGQG